MERVPAQASGSAVDVSAYSAYLDHMLELIRLMHRTASIRYHARKLEEARR